ncbi:hypothetical protein ACEV6Q_04265 [Enterobacter ludwigii]|uniref:hypothetical protein n=1 Tax=Enterobacter ludwigii TaxID=299767 RepID=UPI003BEEEEB1
MSNNNDFWNDARAQRIVSEMDYQLMRKREKEWKSKPVAEKVGNLIGGLLVLALVTFFLHFV